MDWPFPSSCRRKWQWRRAALPLPAHLQGVVDFRWALLVDAVRSPVLEIPSRLLMGVVVLELLIAQHRGCGAEALTDSKENESELGSDSKVK